MASKGQKVAGGAGVVALAIAIATPFIMPFEGKVNASYADVVGVWSACYGHTRGVRPGQYYSDAQCRTLLADDVREHADGVAGCVNTYLPPETMAAAVSLTFNIGIRAFCRSTIARRFNAGDLRSGCDGFLAWNRAGGRVIAGLARRRAAERALCLKGLT